MNYHKTMILAAGLSAALVAGACSPKDPHTERQIRDQTEEPIAQHLLGNLQLTEASKDTIEFEGPTIIWNDYLDHEDLAEIFRKKDIIAETELAYKKNAYILDNYLADLDVNIGSVEEKLNNLNSFSFYNEIAEKIPDLEISTSVWVHSEIENQEIFKNFCYAYVWKMAELPIIKKQNYSKRPKAPQVCQAYLSELFKSAHCTEESSKNYSKCYQNEAINNTQYKIFTLKFPEKIYIEVDEETRNSIKNYLLSEPGQNTFKDIATLAPGRFEYEGKKYYLAFSDKVKRFQLTDTPKKLSDTSLESFGSTFINSEESRKGLKDLLRTRILKIVPEKDPEEHSGEVENANAEDVLEGIVYEYSLHDLMFNMGHQTNPDSPGVLKKMNISDLEEITKLAGTKNSQLFIEISEEDAGLIEKNAQEVKNTEAIKEQLKTIRSEKELERKSLEGPWLTAKADAAIYMLEKNMIEALWGYSHLSVKIEPNYKVELLYRTEHRSDKGGNIFAKACFDALTSQVLNCTFKENEFPMDLMINKETGKLTFTIGNTHGKTFFFNPANPMEGITDPKKITETFFQSEKLTPDFLESGTLQIEIFSGSYKGIIPRMTGKLFFYDSHGVKLFDGEIGLSKAIYGQIGS